MSKYLDNTGLAYFYSKLKAKFATKDLATQSTAGLMSATDKVKVDSIDTSGSVAYYQKVEATYVTQVGTTTTITIPIVGYTSTDLLFVDVNGLELINGVDYTISGTTLTLATPITSAEAIVHFTAIRMTATHGVDVTTIQGATGAGVPVGGSVGQVLMKTGLIDYDTAWQTLNLVPNGGTAGQLLVKQSATDNDTAWETYCPFPVGYVMQMTNGNDPNTLYPGTTWTAINGVFLLASSSSHALGDTGGAETHNHNGGKTGSTTLTAAQSGLPAHTHSFTQPKITVEYAKDTGSGTARNRVQENGSGSSTKIATASGGAVGAVTGGAKAATSGHDHSISAGSNMPPYKVVNVWERTA